MHQEGGPDAEGWGVLPRGEGGEEPCRLITWSHDAADGCMCVWTERVSRMEECLSSGSDVCSERA
ncbi:hypothetical protein DOTSEDRAFT_90530, partial [Dothistroma septosporum NZE10]